MTLDFRHVAGALVLHAILFTLLLTGVQCSRQIDVSQPIQGVLVSPQELAAPSATAPAPSPPEPEPQPQTPPPDNSAQVAQQHAAEQQHEAEVQVQKQAADKAAADAAAQLKVREDAELQQKQAAEKAEADRAAQAKEAQREADEAKRKAEADAAAKQKADDAKRQQDLQQQAQAEDLKRQAEAEDKKRKQDQVKRDAAAEKQRMTDFQKQLGLESGQLAQSVQDQWKGALTAAIARNWTRPSGTDDSLNCQVQMNLAPSGEVLSVSTIRASGNPLYDQSVVAAIRAASPLPTPSDPSVFQSSIKATFSPKLLSQ